MEAQLHPYNLNESVFLLDVSEKLERYLGQETFAQLRAGKSW